MQKNPKTSSLEKSIILGKEREKEMVNCKWMDIVIAVVQNLKASLGTKFLGKKSILLKANTSLLACNQPVWNSLK